MNFDDNGNILPQKLKYRITHEEELQAEINVIFTLFMIVKLIQFS